jgi:hypothetical protein
MRPVGIHTGWWRYPGAYADANFNLKHLVDFIQTLERGRFDAFFMADHLAVLNMSMAALRRSATVTSFEPLTLLSALAMVKQRIGLIATASTTFDEAYHIIARRFASTGPHQQRPSGLEYRDDVEPGRRIELWAGWSRRARRTLPASARIPQSGHRPLG